MEKKQLLLLTLITLVSTLTVLPLPLAQCNADDPQKVADWFNALPEAKQKRTHLHFYFHDTISSKNPTAIRIAESPNTNKYPSLFGFVNMADDPLTVGPDPRSEPVGRAQGLYGSAGQETLGLLMNFNLVFTGEQFNGSTLSLIGRNPILESYREMSIVGGSGVFRLAQGTATAKSYYFNMTSGDAVVEYNVIVLHY